MPAAPKPAQKKKRKKRKNHQKKAIKLAKDIIRNHPDIPVCERCNKAHNRYNGSHIIPVECSQTAADLRNIQKLCTHCHTLGNNSWHHHPVDAIAWLDDYAPGLREVLQKKSLEKKFIDWEEKYNFLKRVVALMEG